MPADTITADQRDALRAAFRPFADAVSRVDIYGSRARREHRPGSDIDLVIEGAQDDRLLAELAAALDDSPLSVPVSVLRYSDLGDTPLRTTVLRDARPLFRQIDLR